MEYKTTPPSGQKQKDGNHNFQAKIISVGQFISSDLQSVTIFNHRGESWNLAAFLWLEMVLKLSAVKIVVLKYGA